jgi:hypothetical protein
VHQACSELGRVVAVRDVLKLAVVIREGSARCVPPTPLGLVGRGLMPEQCARRTGWRHCDSPRKHPLHTASTTGGGGAQSMLVPP